MYVYHCLSSKGELVFLFFVRNMIMLPMLCLVLKFGKTDFFRMNKEKVSWKRKGNCPLYSWIDPMSDGFDR